MKQQRSTGNIEQLRKEFERRLVVMRYAEPTRSHYGLVLKWVEESLADYGEQNYTAEAGERFLHDYILQTKHDPCHYKTARMTIQRLGEILEGKTFAPTLFVRKPECPKRFRALRDEYINHLKRAGSTKSTLNYHYRYTVYLLSGLDEQGVEDLVDLKASDLYAHFTKEGFKICSLSVTRRFLGYLYDQDVTSADLRVCVPKPRKPRSLPSIYTANEVSCVLAAPNRLTVVGKRDFAILMLASRLGLRSCDIMNLTLSDIDRKSATISIIQEKTKRPLTLIVNSDVLEALDAYINDGRPTSQSDKVFLNTKAPYGPLKSGTGFTIAQRYFDKANVESCGRRRGTHALRASYATALINKDIPYSVVKEALGHEDPESIKYYARVDVRRLRACALNVPEPTGSFAVLLGDLEGRL
jgi:integrase